MGTRVLFWGIYDSWCFILYITRGGSRISRRRGCQPSRGSPTYDFAKFCKKLHEIEEILGRRWGAHAGCAPPKSATDNVYLTKHTCLEVPAYDLFTLHGTRNELGMMSLYIMLLFTLHRDRNRNRRMGSKSISPLGPLPGNRFLLYPVPFPVLQYTLFPVNIPFPFPFLVPCSVIKS